MKRTLALLFLFTLITGCVSLNQIYSSKLLYFIDFTPFTEKGFLITPEKYLGSYESIGLINYETKPGAKYGTIYKVNPTYIAGSGQAPYIPTYEWKQDTILIADALNEVYEICISMGADAIMNFNSEIIEDNYSMIEHPVVIRGYRITGFAIKRKDK